MDLIHVREVGLRDGLQMSEHVLPTAAKLAWLRAQAAAGVRRFEATSFVSARRRPQFDDAEIMATEAMRITGVEAGALALNARGSDEALAEFRSVMSQVKARPAEQRPRVLAGVTTAFGCTLQGHVPPERVREPAVAMAEAAARHPSAQHARVGAGQRRSGAGCRGHRVRRHRQGRPAAPHAHRH